MIVVESLHRKRSPSLYTSEAFVEEKAVVPLHRETGFRKAIPPSGGGIFTITFLRTIPYGIVLFVLFQKKAED